LLVEALGRVEVADCRGDVVDHRAPPSIGLPRLILLPDG
jgi:hypothetical protein